LIHDNVILSCNMAHVFNRIFHVFFGIVILILLKYDITMYVLKLFLHKINKQLDLLQCDCPIAISIPLPLNSRDGKGTYNGDTFQH
jgi:hypothetical protein